MTNEIKEILDYLSDDSKSFIICGVSYYKISDYKAKVLLDYITNLQEENEKLKKAVKEKVIATCNTCEWFGVCPHSYKEYDYKAQIDKAIEVIDLIIPELWNISNKMTYRLKDVKNILRGDE